MNAEFTRKLPVPQQIKRRYPVSEALAEIKAKRDKEIADIFTDEISKS